MTVSFRESTARRETPANKSMQRTALRAAADAEGCAARETNLEWLAD